MPPDDDGYLVDMLVAARRAVAFSDDLTYVEFLASELHQSAMKYEVQIVGEAASQVSREMREANPEILWSDIIGMRQHLVHGYTQVNLEILWNAARRHLPPLIAQLERIAPPDEG